MTQLNFSISTAKECSAIFSCLNMFSSISIYLFIFTFKFLGLEALTCPDGKYHSLQTNHISIHFNPKVRSSSNDLHLDYTKNDLKLLIELAASRFHKFAVNYVPPTVNNTVSEKNLHNIPKLIAAFNLLRYSRNFKQVQIYLNAKVGPIIYDLMDTITETNRISPGTIVGVYFIIDDETIGLPSTLKYLQEVKWKRQDLNVKVGVYLYLHMCDLYDDLGSNRKNIKFGIAPLEFIPEIPKSIKLPKRTLEILEAVNFAIFLPGKTLIIHEGVEKSVDYLTKQFKKCEEAIKSAGADVDVHLAYYWPSTDKLGLASEENLVKVWKLLGKWAVGRGKDVFMSKAFDKQVASFDQPSITNHVGWWGLRGTNMSIISKELFYEKICELESYLTKEIQDSSKNNDFEKRLGSTNDSNSDQSNHLDKRIKKDDISNGFKCGGNDIRIHLITLLLFTILL